MGMDRWQPEAFQASEFLDWLLTPEQPRPFKTIAERDDAIRDEVFAMYGPDRTMDQFMFYKRMDRRGETYYVYRDRSDLPAATQPLPPRIDDVAVESGWATLGGFGGLKGLA